MEEIDLCAQEELEEIQQEELAEFVATHWDLLPEDLQLKFSKEYWERLANAGLDRPSRSGASIWDEDLNVAKEHRWDRARRRHIAERVANETGCTGCGCEHCDDVVGCDECCRSCHCWATRETQIKHMRIERRLIEVRIFRETDIGKNNSGGRPRGATAGHLPGCGCEACYRRERDLLNYWRGKCRKLGIEA